jgi:hypothetical protein
MYRNWIIAGAERIYKNIKLVVLKPLAELISKARTGSHNTGLQVDGLGGGAIDFSPECICIHAPMLSIFNER